MYLICNVKNSMHDSNMLTSIDEKHQQSNKERGVSIHHIQDTI